jgi:hypothetical protein
LGFEKQLPGFEKSDSFSKPRQQLLKAPAAASQSPGSSFSKPRQQLLKTPAAASQSPGSSFSKPRQQIPGSRFSKPWQELLKTPVTATESHPKLLETTSKTPQQLFRNSHRLL